MGGDEIAARILTRRSANLMAIKYDICLSYLIDGRLFHASISSLFTGQIFASFNDNFS